MLRCEQLGLCSQHAVNVDLFECTVLSACALALGVLSTLPIGGADMPVVISLLNAFTGTAVAMAGSQATEQMHRAIASRDLIGQAKGIIMERFRVDAVQAFALLTRLSQESNTKLLDVAERVIETRPKHD